MCFLILLMFFQHDHAVIWQVAVIKLRFCEKDIKFLWNHHLRFVLCSNGQTYFGNFAIFCGLLRIYELLMMQNVVELRQNVVRKTLNKKKGKEKKLGGSVRSWAYSFSLPLFLCIVWLVKHAVKYVSTGGPQIVQILRPQGIILLQKNLSGD